MFTDPSGYKWDWNYLNPVHWLSEGMQWINDNTKGLRRKMVDIGVPDFGVAINSAGHTSHYVGNHYVSHNQFRASSPQAIWGRATVTFKNGINQDGVNFTNNLGVSSDNVRVSYDNAANGGNNLWPPYNPGEIRQYEPNIFERYSESRLGQTIVGKALYGVVDDLYITAQCLTIGHASSSHLNRALTIGDETVVSGINTISNLIPFSKGASTLGVSRNVVNAGTFNKIFKGTGVNSAKFGGLQIRSYNGVIRQTSSFNNTWNIIAPSTLMFYGY
ncbi:hypothetical protein SAMN06265379_101953 [Saccharicrinis carchari]|uniref:Uncharacterized protein n=1 Tax=Saccharicrinis carchari TaxID=1168039 RepID=A0A521BIN8_SACCC|nr:hypothetical protein SAMN06265379_101953 [Saccharicrinis carchari]